MFTGPAVDATTSVNTPPHHVPVSMFSTSSMDAGRPIDRCVNAARIRLTVGKLVSAPATCGPKGPDDSLAATTQTVAATVRTTASRRQPSPSTRPHA